MKRALAIVLVSVFSMAVAFAFAPSWLNPVAQAATPTLCKGDCGDCKGPCQGDCGDRCQGKCKGDCGKCSKGQCKGDCPRGADCCGKCGGDCKGRGQCEPGKCARAGDCQKSCAGRGACGQTQAASGDVNRDAANKLGIGRCCGGRGH